MTPLGRYAVAHDQGRRAFARGEQMRYHHVHGELPTGCPYCIAPCREFSRGWCDGWKAAKAEAEGVAA